MHCGWIAHSFEPNIYLYEILKRKYLNTPNVYIYQKAVSNKKLYNKFFIWYRSFQPSRIVESLQDMQKTYEVAVIDLSEILEQFIQEYDSIYLLKLDYRRSRIWCVANNHW